jgi:hypothetical protein
MRMANRAVRFARSQGMRIAPPPAEATAVLPRDAYRRLREIKARYDPDQAIISAHPVRPAGY